MKNFFNNYYNYILASSLLAWSAAQILKTMLNFLSTKKFDPESNNGRLMIAVCEAIMRGLEDAAPVCNHEWFQTGAMLSNEKRCIQCGEWGKLYTSPQVAQTEAALCEMVRLSEDAGLYDSDFQAGRAGSKP